MLKTVIASDKKLLFLRLLLSTLIVFDLFYAKLSYASPTIDNSFLEFRFFISLLLIGLLVGTYFTDESDSFFNVAVIIALIANSLAELYLLHYYKFHHIFLSEFLFTILVTALAWHRMRYVIVYLIGCCTSFIAINILLSAPAFDVISHSILIILHSLIVYAFCIIKLYFENRFRHRGDMLKYLFQDSHESLILTDEHMVHLQYINETARNLFTLSNDPNLKLDILQLFKKYGVEIDIEKVKEQVKSRGSYFTTIELERQDHGTFFGNLYIKPLLASEEKNWLIRILDLTEQQKINFKLQDNWETFSRILDAIPHKIFLKDPEGRFLIVNKTVEEAFGKPKEFFLHKTDFDLYPAVEAKTLQDEERELTSTSRSITLNEEKVTMANGTEKVFQITKMPFYLPQHKQNGIFGLGIDITQISNYQLKLKKSEANYRMLMEQASDGIYSADKYGIITDANPKACQMLGYTKGELIGSNVKSLSDNRDDRIFNIEMIDFNEKKSLIVERKFKKKDGASFMVELSVTILEDGGHQGIMRDITERKRIEKVLQDNEKKFRALIEGSYDITAILDEQLNVTFISPSILKILGYLPKKLEGRPPFDLIHPEDRVQIEKFLRSLLSTPKEFKILPEIRVRAFGGNYRYFEVAGNNMLSDSAVNGLVINLHDISERKNTETQLLNANFELDSFVYRVSHDIKAPLRSVMGLIGIAKLENKQPDISTYLDMMNKSVLNLDHFIKDLTLFSRNSRLELEFKKVDFEFIVEDCIQNLKFMDSVEKIEIRKNIKQNIFFFSDLTRIHTIISNLLSNSFKYHKFEPNKSFVNISISEENNNIVIQVEDNGVGIKPEYQEKIFDMFFRASEKSYGSGLGLYIVKTAVKKLKGEITVHSVPDEGTLFKVVLPRLTVTNNNG